MHWFSRSPAKTQSRSPGSQARPVQRPAEHPLLHGGLRLLPGLMFKNPLYNRFRGWYNLHLMENIQNRRRIPCVKKCGHSDTSVPSAAGLSWPPGPSLPWEASNAEVECPCGKSALKVDFDGEKYHIYVPCGICGETHEAVCPPERVIRGATALGCAKTKQFCCFIGPEGVVEKNLRDLAVLAEKEHQQQEEGEETFSDSVIMYEVLSELKDIAARPDGITCGCGSRRYGMEIRRSAVDLICRDCGGQAPHPRRHGPGPGRPVLPHEAGDPRRGPLTGLLRGR